MRGCVAILFSLITVLVGHISPAAGDDLGVILLHGKGGKVLADSGLRSASTSLALL